MAFIFWQFIQQNHAFIYSLHIYIVSQTQMDLYFFFQFCPKPLAETDTHSSEMPATGGLTLGTIGYLNHLSFLFYFVDMNLKL